MVEEEKTQLDPMQMDIEEILKFMIGLSSSKSIQYLGVPLESGKEPKKDLERAKLAIDCTSYLAEKLEPYVPEDEVKQLKAMVSNLKLAYVRES